MNEEIFIVFNDKDSFVESVWNTQALAESAKIYHSGHARQDISNYVVVKRRMNSVREHD